VTKLFSRKPKKTPVMAKQSAFSNALVALVALAALAYLVFAYSKNRTMQQSKEEYTGDGFDAGSMGVAAGSGGSPIPRDPAATAQRTVDYPAAPSADAASLPDDCFPKDRLVAADLLPKDAANEKWARVNPAGQGDVDDKNYLNAGYHHGLNTVAGTLRNANLQLRSEPPNPRAQVTPWNQSTIEPDLNRRPFEIDGGCV
jgi:hypothetical protein